MERGARVKVKCLISLSFQERGKRGYKPLEDPSEREYKGKIFNNNSKTGGGGGKLLEQHR